MTTPNNKAILQRALQEIFNEGRLETAEQLIAPNYLNHTPTAGQLRGPAGVQQVARLYRSAFPDLNLTITHLLADGDFLAVQVRESGTHLGSFAGVEPGGRYISWEWIGLYRVQAGQLIERWGLIETPAFWEQLRGT